MADYARRKKKGVVLFLILAALAIAIILAAALLSLMLNQARITNHQVSRVRAFYAAQAGINLAMEQLRTHVWVGTGTHILSKDTAICSSAGNICDDDIPFPVTINITSTGGIFNISATADYTSANL